MCHGKEYSQPVMHWTLIHFLTRTLTSWPPAIFLKVPGCMQGRRTSRQVEEPDGYAMLYSAVHRPCQCKPTADAAGTWQCRGTSQGLPPGAVKLPAMACWDCCCIPACARRSTYLGEGVLLQLTVQDDIQANGHQSFDDVQKAVKHIAKPIAVKG